MKRTARGMCVVILLAGWTTVVSAGSLQTPFTKVRVRDVPVGRWTRVQLADGRDYTVRNSSDRTVEIRLRAAKPFDKPKGANVLASIPNPAWVTVKPVQFPLKPGATGTAEVRIVVPDQPEYAGKTYEVWLVAETVGGQFGVGLITRIQFNTVLQPTESEADTPELGKPEDPPATEAAAP